MLKLYRRSDFCHSSFDEGENDDVESGTFRLPHPSDIDVLGGVDRLTGYGDESSPEAFPINKSWGE